MAIAHGSIEHLRASGVSLVIDTRHGGLPSVLHYGPDLGELTPAELDALALASRGPYGDSRIEIPERVSVVPAAVEGWTHTPGLSGSRDGRDFSPEFLLSGTTAASPTVDVADGRRYECRDDTARLALAVEIVLTRAGVVKLRARLTNLDPAGAGGATPYRLERLILTLPVPSEAVELLDFTGRHTAERIPQRSPFRVGTHVRESRKGKPGLDSVYLLAAGSADFGFTRGEVWALHLGWSGNQVAFAERGHGLWVVDAGDDTGFVGFVGLWPVPPAIDGGGGV